MNHSILKKCRLCNSDEITSVLNLGLQELTGFFPAKDEEVVKLPLELANCNNCGLSQLYHDFDIGQLYGETYGYRSGLNKSMIKHLNDVSTELTSIVTVNEHDSILDIGSNDGTLLGSYENRENVCFVGIDPSAKKFKHYYKDDITLIVDFFSKEKIEEMYTNKKFKIVTSIAMFYDLPDPVQFVKDIHDILDDSGIWFSEQSYCLSMIKAKSFDTICHEHLEYYCLKQFKQICDTANMKIVKISFNDINGGSFNCVVTKKTNDHLNECTADIDAILNDEIEFWKTDPFQTLKRNIELTKANLFKLFDEIQGDNKVIHGYGASTKGNVLLQYFGIGTNILKCICEVNEYKFGKYTPGTRIPIVSDLESKNKKPDYYFVLPWHFRENIINKELDYLKSGGKLIFPLPDLDIVSYEK